MESEKNKAKKTETVSNVKQKRIKASSICASKASNSQSSLLRCLQKPLHGASKSERRTHREEHSCQSHSFFTDVADVRQMEQGLLQLLDDFHSGKLQAFGNDITFEKMDCVREHQEKLARLHFDLNAQQDIYGHDSEDGRRIAKENMLKLTENLQQLSVSIEQLQSRTSKSGPSYSNVQ